MLDPTRYLGGDSKFLRERYVEVCCQLAGLYVQQHDTIVAERKARHTAYWNSEETTVAGRNRVADAESIDLSIAVDDVKAEISQYQEEREMLRMLLWGDNA